MEGSSHTSTCPNRSWICPSLIWSDCLYLGWKIWAYLVRNGLGSLQIQFSSFQSQLWSVSKLEAELFLVGVCWRFGFCFFLLPILKRWIYQMPGQAGVLDHEGSATVLLNLSVTSAASSTQGVKNPNHCKIPSISSLHLLLCPLP